MTTLLLLAVALSMDAFAAALSQGAAARASVTLAGALRIGIAFGVAQAIMPLVGWALGTAFAPVIEQIDHWIAFVLLAGIGLRMVHQGLQAATRPADAPVPLAAGGALLFTAFATSVDAAAAGVTIALLDQPVLLACGVIGTVTLVLSTAGVLVGTMAGALVGSRAEVAGGLVLIAIGTKTLIEHVFYGG